MNMPLRLRPETLAEVIERLERSRTLTEVQRRDLVSAVNSAARLLDRAPADLTTDIPQLRAALLGAQHVLKGISRKRFSNVKSGLQRALELTRAIARSVPRTGVTTDWRPFLQTAEADYQRYVLARFSRYCACRGIEPQAVTDTVMAEYLRHLDGTQVIKCPRQSVKKIIETWNRMAARSNHPLAPLEQIDLRRKHARPLTEYPGTLQAEIATYLDRLGNPGLFDDEGPAKPLKPITLRNITANLRQFLDALVNAGHDPASFPSLADLVRPEVMRAGLEQLYKQHGGKVPTGAQNIAGTLTAIARYHVKLSEPELDRLRNLKSRVTLTSTGMTSKNMERLGQFADISNRAALFLLPERLIARARQRPESSRSAFDAMHAVAIMILLNFPIRIANLAALDLDQHLSWQVRGSSRRLTIRIEGNEVKNGETLEADLHPDTSRMVWTYISQFRSRISTTPGSALFPKASEGPRRPDNLGQSISMLVERETGLKINAHLFRHLAGMLFLEANAGEYESLRRILAHRRLDTTMHFYTQFESKSALARYDEAVLTPMRRRKP